MNKYINLDYSNYPPLLGISVKIPNKTLLYKSYDKSFPILSERPSYFSSLSNAEKYLDVSDRKLAKFLPKDDLNLLDIRYVKHILNDLILSRKNNDKKIIESYLTLSLSYGLISLKEQIKLYKIRYSELTNDDRYKKIKKYYKENSNLNYFSKNILLNPIELQGIRIGETTNDVSSTFILKNIFGDSFDGIISPNLESPYHYKTDNIIPCEILLFNPIKTLTINKKKISEKNIFEKNIINILTENNIYPIATSYNMSNGGIFYYKGGYKTNNNFNSFIYINEKNNYIDNMNEKDIKYISKYGILLKKLLNIDYDRYSKVLEYIKNKDVYIEKKVCSWS